MEMCIEEKWGQRDKWVIFKFFQAFDAVDGCENIKHFLLTE